MKGCRVIRRKCRKRWKIVLEGFNVIFTVKANFFWDVTLLISRILEYKGVRIEGELTQAIQAIGTEIGETTFRQMGFVARGRVIIHKDDDYLVDEDDDMDAHMAESEEVVAPSEAGPSTMPSSSSLSMEEYFTNLSKQLEDMSLAHQARFDELIEMQQTHEEYVIEKFDDFDTRLGNNENRLNVCPLKDHLLQISRLGCLFAYF
ncbi:hypothetical protein LR48_Vigan09g090000 [Vigna angularis]|uniref:Uncharacterized protein n=1 Tax=Phaseolus angularis TaxID=3914 RepID=A0A0L9VAZ7_PHAAN|nr:hypothetical protein LR48_Vigan09g090000 [Vigna angularis]